MLDFFHSRYTNISKKIYRQSIMLWCIFFPYFNSTLGPSLLLFIKDCSEKQYSMNSHPWATGKLSIHDSTWLSIEGAFSGGSRVAPNPPPSFQKQTKNAHIWGEICYRMYHLKPFDVSGAFKKVAVQPVVCIN